MFAACIEKKGIERIKKLNHLGIDEGGKRKSRVSIKNDTGRELDQFCFDNVANGIGNLLFGVKTNSTTATKAVTESS